MARRFLRREIPFPCAKIVPLQFWLISHMVRIKIGECGGRCKIRRVLRFRQRRSGYSSSREFEPRHLAGKIFPIPAVKTRRSARGPKPFRAFIAPGGMYGGARQFLPWKIPFPGAKIVPLQFLPVSHTVRMKIGECVGKRRIRRIRWLRQRRNGYSSS